MLSFVSTAYSSISGTISGAGILQTGTGLWRSVVKSLPRSEINRDPVSTTAGLILFGALQETTQLTDNGYYMCPVRKGETLKTVAPPWIKPICDFVHPGLAPKLDEAALGLKRLGFGESRDDLKPLKENIRSFCDNFFPASEYKHEKAMFQHCARLIYRGAEHIKSNYTGTPKSKETLDLMEEIKKKALEYERSFDEPMETAASSSSSSAHATPSSGRQRAYSRLDSDQAAEPSIDSAAISAAIETPLVTLIRMQNESDNSDAEEELSDADGSTSASKRSSPPEDSVLVDMMPDPRIATIKQVAVADIRRTVWTPEEFKEFYATICKIEKFRTENEEASVNAEVPVVMAQLTRNSKKFHEQAENSAFKAKSFT